MKFILEAFADRVADEIKPSDIDTWISSHKWSAATKNRYKMYSGRRSRLRWQTAKTRAILRGWLSNDMRITHPLSLGGRGKEAARGNQETIPEAHAGIRRRAE